MTRSSVATKYTLSKCFFCMHICIFVCMYVQLCVYICIYIVCVYTGMCLCVIACARMCIFMCWDVCMLWVYEHRYILTGLPVCGDQTPTWGIFSHELSIFFLSQSLSLGLGDCQLGLTSWLLSPRDPPTSASCGFVLQMVESIPPHLAFRVGVLSQTQVSSLCRKS